MSCTKSTTQTLRHFTGQYLEHQVERSLSWQLPVLQAGDSLHLHELHLSPKMFACAAARADASVSSSSFHELKQRKHALRVATDAHPAVTRCSYALATELDLKALASVAS